MMNQNIEFTNTLIYPSHIPKSMNSKAIDNTHCRVSFLSPFSSMFVGNDQTGKRGISQVQILLVPGIVYSCTSQRRSHSGVCLFLFYWSSRYVVYADEDIPKNTLICEYCGVLETVENCEHCDNDSIMDLVYTKYFSNLFFYYWLEMTRPLLWLFLINKEI